jgi:hypothetical protein
MGEKEAYPPAGTSLQRFAHRCNYSCEEKTAGKYLQTFSSDFFAQRDDLCGQLHVVYPGRSNYSCGSVPASLYLWREGLYSKAKRRAMDRTTAQCVVAFNVLWM